MVKSDNIKTKKTTKELVKNNDEEGEKTRTFKVKTDPNQDVKGTGRYSADSPYQAANKALSKKIIGGEKKRIYDELVLEHSKKNKNFNPKNITKELRDQFNDIADEKLIGIKFRFWLIESTREAGKKPRKWHEYVGYRELLRHFIVEKDKNGNPKKDKDGNLIYEVEKDEDGNPLKDSKGKIIYKKGEPKIVTYEVVVKDKDGNPKKDENGNNIVNIITKKHRNVLEKIKRSDETIINTKTVRPKAKKTATKGTKTSTKKTTKGTKNTTKTDTKKAGKSTKNTTKTITKKAGKSTKSTKNTVKKNTTPAE